APVPKRAELEGIAVLERLRRPRPLRQEDLVRVAREADFERLLLPEQLERSHPDVGPRRRVRRLDDLDVPAARAVAGLAVDREGPPARRHTSGLRVADALDPAAVAVEAAVRERIVSERAVRRPIVRRGE